VVPHQTFLDAVALLAACRPSERALIDDELESWGCQAPLRWEPRLIYNKLPPERRPRLLFFDPTIQSPLTEGEQITFIQAIGAQGLLRATPTGPVWEPAIQAFVQWRQHKSLRIFLETCLLAGVAVPQVAVDVRTCWGVAPTEDDIAKFARLFADREGLLGMGWLHYAHCIGEAEADFKRKLITQPHDFLRWKLGVPVSLDSTRVIERLVSDAYYTERLLKAEIGDNGLHMPKETLARIKMERDTMFKGIDRLIKLRDGGTDSEEKQKVREALSQFELVDSADGEFRSLDDLLAENG
jgi:hypothetical protein